MPTPPSGYGAGEDADDEAVDTNETAAANYAALEADESPAEPETATGDEPAVDTTEETENMDSQPGFGALAALAALLAFGLRSRS